MTNEKLYSAYEICEELKITNYTLSNWYRWEKKQLKEGLIEKSYLPQPIRVENEKGKPRRWDDKMLKQLKDYKGKIVMGRNGVYGIYSNPLYKETKKYKKSIETIANE